ncbi:MAG TPA: alpha/beta hydrolase [Actinomycetota bacterium]|nr:alpha/beta hydrolase [Actinomycetota bacterium]
MSGLPRSVERWRDAGRFIDAGPHRVFMTGDGERGPDVLILHGFPASSYQWRNVIPHLAGKARVTAFDFLGYGLSDKPADPRVTLFDQAGLAEHVAAGRGIERCAIVAHDMGDTVAAELLHRQNAGELPFEIDRVILTNGSIYIDMAQLSAGQQLLLQLPDEPLAESLPLDGFKPGITETFSREHPPGDAEVEALLALIAHNDGDRLLPRLIRYIEERRQNQQRWTDALNEFTGLLWAVWGEQDPIAVVAMAHELKAQRPMTEIEIWPDVGHWPEIEVPERLAGAVMERL